METVTSDKKELAEKVVGMLGEVGVVIFSDGETVFIDRVENEWYEKIPFFSWPTVGLCIEKAREMGWRLCIAHNSIHFYKDGQNSTEWYRVEDYDHIEAIIGAFAEIPMEVEG